MDMCSNDYNMMCDTARGFMDAESIYEVKQNLLRVLWPQFFLIFVDYLDEPSFGLG